MARAGQMCAPALMPSGVRVFLRLFFKFSWVVGVWRGRVRASSPLSPGGFRWCKWHYRSFSPLPNIHFRSAFSPFSPQIQFCDVVSQWSHHCVILAHYADDSQSPTITPFKGIGLTRSRKRTLQWQWELFLGGNGWGGGGGVNAQSESPHDGGGVGKASQWIPLFIHKCWLAHCIAGFEAVQHTGGLWDVRDLKAVLDQNDLCYKCCTDSKMILNFVKQLKRYDAPRNRINRRSGIQNRCSPPTSSQHAQLTRFFPNAMETKADQLTAPALW